MTKKIELHLWSMNEKKYYRSLGTVSGETLADAVRKYSNVARKLGLTIYRADGDFGYYEDKEGRRLFASLKRRKQ